MFLLGLLVVTETVQAGAPEAFRSFSLRVNVYLVPQTLHSFPLIRLSHIPALLPPSLWPAVPSLSEGKGQLHPSPAAGGRGWGRAELIATN